MVKLKPKLFLFCTNDVKDLATKIHSSLLSTDYDIFFESKDMLPGSAIPAVIRTHVESSKHVICLLSPAWKESTYLKSLLEQAINQDVDTTKRKVIPIVVGENFDLPDIITSKNLHCIDFSNWKNEYRNLIKKLRAAIVDQGNLLKVHHAQAEMIKNSSAIRDVSFGFLLPDLYIQPNISTHKYPANWDFNLFVENQGKNKNIALIGVPGSGKTTTLRTLFYEFHSNQEINLTLYFTAKEIIASASKKIPTLVSLLKAMYSINIRTADFKHQNIVLFIDGVDEIDPKKFDALFMFCKKLKEEGIIFWIGVRSDIYYSHISNSPNDSLFHEVCKLTDWTRKQGMKFVRRYSKKSNNNLIVKNVNTLLKNNNKVLSFLENPFKLSLLVFILSDRDYDISRIKPNDYILYKEFYSQWLEKEKKRGTSHNNNDYIRNSHIKIAIELYRERLSVPLSKMLSNECNIEKIINDSAIIGLLITNDNALDGTIVEKFQHETLAEFLVAEGIIDSFRNGIKLNELMDTVYNYEVNLFVRSAFEVMTLRERNLIFNNLSNKYNELLTDKTAIAERIREQFIYYIGRIPLSSPPDILRFVYEHEGNPFIKRAAALSLILLGEEEVEKDFIEKLLSDKELELLNRSFQLIYFGDTQGDYHTYRDNGLIGWKNTKRATLERFSNNSTRSIKLRLWDIVTFKSFIDSRGLSGLTDDEIEIIKKMIINDPTISKPRYEILNREKNSLLTYLSENKVLL
ncbi:MAG: TIR domain-containing protein [Treponema sp.]|nr:TIR domain-containing protein [Treponema sp.]